MAPSQAARLRGYLVVKIHMSRSVYQVENILASILGLIYGTDCLGLDGNSPLTFQVHIIQYLLLHLPAGEKSCFLNNTVSQGGLAVVNVCYNAKIANFTLVNCWHALSSFRGISSPEAYVHPHGIRFRSLTELYYLFYFLATPYPKVLTGAPWRLKPPHRCLSGLPPRSGWTWDAGVHCTEGP